ncbi:pentatricopeptide repeat-containing protein [Senna tora]|uniref:Pentatricopeptide repeat-containing protein n=1 Tax=Senna tora TaxID=362788 RepID=A0A834SRN3_9FABA|nr:pentatricopeptide repeat-containing protein [Senna tora]
MKEFPTVQRLMSLFDRCSTMNHLKQIHARIILTGYAQHPFVVGKILLFCSVSVRGDMNYALSVFDSLQKPDAFLWNTMIRGFSNTTQFHNSIHFYRRMQEKGAKADNFTLAFLLKVIGGLGSLSLGKQFHCKTIKLGLENHAYVGNSLMHMYGMLKDIDTAHQLFERMPNVDLVAWNSIIDSHVNCKNYKEALQLFTRMVQSGIQPDDATLVVTLSACAAIGALEIGRYIHSCIRNTDLADITSVCNSLVGMYAKCGAVDEAYDTFNKTKVKCVVSWNVMIQGLASHGDGKEALAFFSRMLEENGVRPDEVTFLGVLYACSHGGMVDEGRRYFDIMSRDFNIQPTMKHYGCMVDLLARAGLVEEAYNLIESMPMECNAIVWRTLLAACRVHGYVELGETVRKKLLKLEPDHSSDYVLLASMYASAGQWNEMSRERRSMHERGVQKPKPGNSFIGISEGSAESKPIERLL